jgi:hypothetical protein
VEQAAQLFEPPVHFGQISTQVPHVLGDGGGGGGGVEAGGGLGGAGGLGGVGGGFGPDHAAARSLKKGELRWSANPKLMSHAPAPRSFSPSCSSRARMFCAVMRPCDWPTCHVSRDQGW